MQKKNLNSNKRQNGKIKDQPIGELSQKQIKRYFKKEYGMELCPFNEFDSRKPAKNFLQVREEYSQDALIELLGKELFQEVFINAIISTKGKGKNSIDEEIISPEDECLFEFMQLSRFDRRRLQRKGGYCVNKNGQIILFSAMKLHRKVIAVMKLKGSKPEITKQVNDMIDTAEKSTYVDIADDEISALRDLAKKYGDSHAATGESAFTNLNNGMQGMMSKFQIFANDNPNLAIVAIKSGGFSVKTITPRGRQKWGAFQTKIEGKIKITHEGCSQRSAHDWWISVDGVIFYRLCPTTAAETFVEGYRDGTQLYFMHQLITKDGPQGFDLTVSVTVGAR